MLVEGDTEDLKDGLDTGVIVGTVVGFWVGNPAGLEQRPVAAVGCLH